ncbi:MAG TPA: hypothetical protein VHX20_18755 [Terracidiphilus sp.]|nr:hypothetical protein [Terracidiphilus sp.]
MKLTIKKWLRAAPVALLCVVAAAAPAQAPTTTTVTGTVYLANGQPGAGTLVLSWPAFTTAAGQLIAADTTTVTIPSDGFVSINLVPNQGSMPAGEYYTAIFYMSDGSTHTQYWVVPAAASATLAALQSQVMPAAQAVQTVSKSYVDQAIADLASGEITASGGSLSGPLFLNGDPTQPLQAADKHYVDSMISAGGGSGTVNTGVTNQVAIYSAPGTAVSGSNSLNLSGPAMAAGMQDTLSNFPLNSWACGGSGSDEGQKIDNCITTDIAHSMGGRRYLSAATGAMTWTENPFAPLSVSSGQPAEKGSFELDLSPNATVTADQEIDMGFDSLLDCGNGYPGGDGPGSAGTYIQPEASGYPTSTLIGLGTLATNTTAQVLQGSKLMNCGLSSNGVTGMTAVDESQTQEGGKAVNNRLFGFQICFNDDSNATIGGAFHFWGNFDNQCEMEDDTDSTVWGARYGYNKQGIEAGIIQNFSTIGGANPNGTTKIGIENDSNGLMVLNQTEEGMTYGLLSNAAHSSSKYGNLYVNIGCSSAGAASSICGEDDNVGPDQGSIWMNIAGNSSNTNFVQLNQPSAAVATLHGDPSLGLYLFDAGANIGNATVLTNSPQIANSNLKFGDSYSNAAAWPAMDLPAKTLAMTISGNTFIGTEYMTTSDHAGGIIPEGLATNGDLVKQTSVTPHAMALTRHGPGNCIFDGATTANDYAVTSSAVWNSTSAIDCHDSGSTSPPASGPYIGKVQKTVASAPSTPTAPTVTTNCTGTCATTYSYKWVAMADTDPLDHTQSAGSTAGSVSGPATLTSTIKNTISGCSTGSASTPCELFETAGPHIGWLQEVINTSSVIDNGIIGTAWGVGHGAPLTVGVIDPPVHVELGQSGASIATSSTPGVVQPDNTTITVDGSGVLSTAAGSVMPSYWNSQGDSAGQSFSLTANTQYAAPYPITAQVQFNQMCVYVNTADSGGGLYAMALVKLTSPICTGTGCATTTEAHWSAQTLSSMGLFCAANAEGSVAVTPGLYYMVTTGSATTAKWAQTDSVAQQFTNLSDLGAGTSSSGVLGTITLDVMTGGLQVISGGGGPIWVGLSQ